MLNIMFAAKLTLKNHTNEKTYLIIFNFGSNRC